METAVTKSAEALGRSVKPQKIEIPGGCTACCTLVACLLQAVRCLLAAGCTLLACCSGATSILFRVVVVEVGQSRGGDADAIRACPCV